LLFIVLDYTYYVSIIYCQLSSVWLKAKIETPKVEDESMDSSFINSVINENKTSKPPPIFIQETNKLQQCLS